MSIRCTNAKIETYTDGDKYISGNCPHCGSGFIFSENALGKVVNCPTKECNKKFLLVIK